MRCTRRTGNGFPEKVRTCLDVSHNFIHEYCYILHELSYIFFIVPQKADLFQVLISILPALSSSRLHLRSVAWWSRAGVFRDEGNEEEQVKLS